MRIKRSVVPSFRTLVFVLMLLPPSSLHAIVVTTTADENGTNPAACALREAVQAIHDQSSFGGCPFVSGDTSIELGAETYTLSLDLGLFDRVNILTPLTILGRGPDQTTIERSGAFDDDLLNVVVNEPGIVHFEGFTLRGTRGLFKNAISFVAMPDVAFVLRDLILRDNVAEDGPAFRLQGGGDSQVLFERVIFEDNTSFGEFANGGGFDCSADDEAVTPSPRFVDVIFRNNRVEAAAVAFGGRIRRRFVLCGM